LLKLDLKHAKKGTTNGVQQEPRTPTKAITAHSSDESEPRRKPKVSKIPSPLSDSDEENLDDLKVMSQRLKHVRVTSPLDDDEKARMAAKLRKERHKLNLSAKKQDYKKHKEEHTSKTVSYLKTLENHMLESSPETTEFIETINAEISQDAMVLEKKLHKLKKEQISYKERLHKLKYENNLALSDSDSSVSEDFRASKTNGVSSKRGRSKSPASQTRVLRSLSKINGELSSVLDMFQNNLNQRNGTDQHYPEPILSSTPAKDQKWGQVRVQANDMLAKKWKSYFGPDGMSFTAEKSALCLPVSYNYDPKDHVSQFQREQNGWFSKNKSTADLLASHSEWLRDFKEQVGMNSTGFPTLRPSSLGSSGKYSSIFSSDANSNDTKSPRPWR